MSSTIWLRHSKPPTISVGIRRSVHSAGNPLGMEMATRADPPLTQNLFQTNSLKVNRASHGVWPTAHSNARIHAARCFLVLFHNVGLECDIILWCVISLLSGHTLYRKEAFWCGGGCGGYSLSVRNTPCWVKRDFKQYLSNLKHVLRRLIWRYSLTSSITHVFIIMQKGKSAFSKGMIFVYVIYFRTH